MTPWRAKAIFATGAVTLAATVANHWPRHGYVDRIHFGAEGQASLARAIAEVL